MERGTTTEIITLPDRDEKVERIADLAGQLLAELLTLPLDESFTTTPDRKIILTQTGSTTEQALLTLEGLRKAIDDIESAKRAELADTMAAAGVHDVILHPPGSNSPIVTYEYTRPRAIRQMKFDRLEAEHPDTYKALKARGYIVCSTSDRYTMKRISYEHAGAERCS